MDDTEETASRTRPVTVLSVVNVEFRSGTHKPYRWRFVIQVRSWSGLDYGALATATLDCFEEMLPTMFAVKLNMKHSTFTTSMYDALLPHIGRLR